MKMITPEDIFKVTKLVADVLGIDMDKGVDQEETYYMLSLLGIAQGNMLGACYGVGNDFDTLRKMWEKVAVNTTDLFIQRVRECDGKRKSENRDSGDNRGKGVPKSFLHFNG